MNASQKSPFKSLHIKGKNEAIKERLEEDNFAGVQVVDFGIKESNQPISHIRQNRELSSMHSQHKLGNSSIQGDLIDTRHEHAPPSAHHHSNAGSQQFLGH